MPPCFEHETIEQERCQCTGPKFLSDFQFNLGLCPSEKTCGSLRVQLCGRDSRLLRCSYLHIRTSYRQRKCLRVMTLPTRDRLRIADRRIQDDYRRDDLCPGNDCPHAQSTRGCGVYRRSESEDSGALQKRRQNQVHGDRTRAAEKRWLDPAGL